MATTSSLPNDPARFGTQPAENRAHDAIWENNHAISMVNDGATDEKPFLFLNLAVELQIKVLSYVTSPSTLRALCLVSTEVADIATPRLFSKIDLRQEDWSQEPLIRQRARYIRTLKKINSLLRNSKNLRFVRMLKTSYLTPGFTQLVGRLLPLFRDDYLERITFAPKSILCFPTPNQLHFLLSHQRKVVNFKLVSHMVPSVEEYLRDNEQSRNHVLAFFKRLHIHDQYDGCATNTPHTMYWPLVNLDFSVLRELHVNGLAVPPHVLARLNALFASGILVNLSRLVCQWIEFDDTLTLTNLPSLRLLNLAYCNYGKPQLPVVFKNGFHLQYFWYSTCENIMELVPVLAQIKGLEHLCISGIEPVWEVDKAQRDLAQAISLYKDTLITLDLGENLNLHYLIGRTMWDFHVVEVIKGCQKLQMLSLPLPSDRPPRYYRHLARDLPQLLGLTVYDGINTASNWDSETAVRMFPTTTELSFIHFKGPGTLLNNNDTYEQRFERRDLEEFFDAEGYSDAEVYSDAEDYPDTEDYADAEYYPDAEDYPDAEEVGIVDLYPTE